jgi:hypothetical protein
MVCFIEHLNIHAVLLDFTLVLVRHIMYWCILEDCRCQRVCLKSSHMKIKWHVPVRKLLVEENYKILNSAVNTVD